MEHNERAKIGNHGNKEIQLCEKAIRKYGTIQEFDILEEIKEESLLDEREWYWIEFYNSNNREKGYNLLDKGNVSGRRGTEHTNAAFTKEELDDIIDLLLNHTELSYIDIAEKYHVNKDTIYRISAGLTYINPNLTYPLRSRNYDFNKKTDILDFFSSEQELINLKEELKYSWWLQMDNGDLYKKYNISRRLLYDINYGRKFAEIGNYSYPIRSSNKQKKYFYKRRNN